MESVWVELELADVRTVESELVLESPLYGWNQHQTSQLESVSLMRYQPDVCESLFKGILKSVRDSHHLLTSV